jgi:hypothetical protein
MTILEQLQDEMIAEVQRLSQLGEALTHFEWEESLHRYEKKIRELPIPDQGGIDTELFYPIEPE